MEAKNLQLKSHIEKEPKAGPKPISLEEYRRRNKKVEELPKPSSNPPKAPFGGYESKKKRGGHQSGSARNWEDYINWRDFAEETRRNAFYKKRKY